MRLLGYRRDITDPRDRRAADLLGALPAAGSVSLRGHVSEVLRQQGNDCVAHALVQALRVLWSVQGDPSPPLVSRRLVYYGARARHGAQREDQGTYPRLAMTAVREDGYALESACPYEPARYAEPPPPSAYRASYDQSGGRLTYYRCSDRPAERRREIESALASLRPVTIGVQVDQMFLDDPGPFWRRVGPAIGGHAMCAVGYSERGLLIVNSWGTGWGDGGFCTLAWDSVCDPSVTSDPYVLATAKEPS
jgi:hypothetical protein